MTSSFVETAKSRTAKRTYDPIANVESYEEGLSRFLADTTMGLTKKELSSSAYKVKVEYFDAAGDDKGYVNMYAADKTAYEEMASLLAGNEATETAAGIGGTASRDSAEDTWSTRYSCAIGEDTFTVTITREYMHITGFEEDATLAAIEAWADTVAVFGGEEAGA